LSDFGRETDRPDVDQILAGSASPPSIAALEIAETTASPTRSEWSGPRDGLGCVTVS